MGFAVDLATQSIQSDSREVPVSAVVVNDSHIVAYSINRVECNNVSWHHAEFLAIKQTQEILNSKYLETSSIYITLEPCVMCSALLNNVRIKEIYFGAYNIEHKGLTYYLNDLEYIKTNTNIIGGIYETKCSNILNSFFSKIRHQNI